MRTILKWTLEWDERQVLRMPRGAEVLTVNVQSDHLTLWVLVDAECPLVERFFFLCGTGSDRSVPCSGKYLGTCVKSPHTPHGHYLDGYVCHLFEVYS